MSEIRDLLERTRPVLLGSCCIYTKVHLHIKEQEFMKYSERNQDKVKLVCNFHQLCNTNLTLLWVLTSKHRSFYPRDESINFKSDQEYYLLIMCRKPKQNWKEMKSAVPVHLYWAWSLFQLNRSLPLISMCFGSVPYFRSPVFHQLNVVTPPGSLSPMLLTGTFNNLLYDKNGDARTMLYINQTYRLSNSYKHRSRKLIQHRKILSF